MSGRSEALVLSQSAIECDVIPLEFDDSSASRTSRKQQLPVAIIKIARLWPGARRAAAAALPPVTPVDADPLRDSLEAFGSETPETASPPPAPRPVVIRPKALAGTPVPEPRDQRPVSIMALWLLIAVLGATASAAGVWAFRQRMAMPSTGSLAIQTTPAGLPVAIDGRSAGITPLTITLAPASYKVQVGEGEQRRDLAVTISAGSAILQHLELPVPTAAVTPSTGTLRIQTEPAGQIVSVDGVDRGASPLTIHELAAGDHSVVVRGAGGVLRRTVAVKAGDTVSLLVAPIAPSTPAPGWLSVQSPTRLEIREDGKLLGSTDTEQIMLAAGRYEIELANDVVGYRARRSIEVLPGQTTSVPVELPYGTLSINAQPWAEVWINGERIGDTPIANLSRRIGTYDVVFRHPDLGERKETVNVTLRQPVRLGVDMRSK
jgi:hypothetical protein